MVSGPLICLLQKSDIIAKIWRMRSLMNPDKALTEGFEAIASIADGLSITLVERKSLRGRSLNVVLAACLFIACRE